MKRTYKVVDVFTDRPLFGNPVAVILDTDGLDAAAMQRIARWTNLSETTFVLPPSTPEADYRLRIFAPLGELPFAGHPTLGSAHAVLQSRRSTRKSGELVQECGVGLVHIKSQSDKSRPMMTLELPSATITPLASPDIDELEAVLGHAVVRSAAPAIVNVGAVWVIAQLPTVESLLGLTPDFARCDTFERRLGVTGLTVFAAYDHGGIEVRSFAPSSGVPEDPVCGSGNGSVAVFRCSRGLLPTAGANYVAMQGRCVGRDGRVSVNVDASGKISLGGGCVTTVEGVLDV